MFLSNRFSIDAVVVVFFLSNRFSIDALVVVYSYLIALVLLLSLLYILI